MRQLNEREKEILLKKEGRTDKKFNVLGIEYKKLHPRTILCIIRTCKEVIHRTLSTDYYGEEIKYGVSMRSRRDKDSPLIGETIAFVRALDSI